MAFADRAKNRVKGVLSRYNLTPKTIYKREIHKGSGDALIGRTGPATVLDTLMDPQPIVNLASHDNTLMVNGDSIAVVGDYICTAAADAISRTELESKNFSIVMKDDVTEHEFFVVAWDAVRINGVDVIFRLVLRSRKR